MVSSLDKSCEAWTTTLAESAGPGLTKWELEACARASPGYDALGEVQLFVTEKLREHALSGAHRPGRR